MARSASAGLSRNCWPPTRRRSGWYGDYYIPSVDEGPVNHPIADVYLTIALPHPDQPQGPNNLPRPVIRAALTRPDFQLDSVVKDRDIVRQREAPERGMRRFDTGIKDRHLDASASS